VRTSGIAVAVALMCWSLGALAQEPAASLAPVQPAAGQATQRAFTFPVTAAPSQVKPRSFNLFDAIRVTAEAPPPEAVDALRGKLALITTLRRGWYTGPDLKGPIFNAWNAVDYTDYARSAYYGVPYYMRSSASYYLGPPSGVAADSSSSRR
jgi:hypothetical protein